MSKYNPFNIKEVSSEEMDINPVSLSFTGTRKNLEPRFIKTYTENSLFQVRIALLLGGILVALFEILDLILITDAQVSLMILKIRFFYIIPSLIVFLFFSFRKQFKEHMQFYIFAASILVGTGIIGMLAIAPPLISFEYYAGLIILLFFIYSFAGLRFLWATSAGLFIIFLYEVTAVLTDKPLLFFISNNFFLLSANFLGMFVCYFIEKSNRKNFFQSSLIKENHTKMERVAREWRTTFDSVNDNILLLDKKGIILRVNTACSRTFEKPFSFFLGESFEKIFQGIPHTFSTSMFSHKKPVSVEFFEPMLNEFIELNVFPITDLHENISGNVISARNISERKKLENLKNDFVSTVSHELRTPLAIIKEGILLIYDGILRNDVDKEKRTLEISIQSIERLEKIITDLLDISKIEAGKVLLEKQPVSIHMLIQNIIRIFKPRIEGKGLFFKESIQTEPLTFTIDEGKIIQVLTNLLENALKFTQKGGITLSVKEIGEFIEFSIQDTGIGISKENLSRVFDKFHQFGRVNGPGTKGTGLGLAISKKITELHNGKISVTSTLGKGTTFRVILPKE